MKEEVVQRFLRYVKVNTQSNEHSDACPSTEGQWELARLLCEELTAMGMEEVTLDEHGYVMATLPANTDKVVPTVGFLAHMDTSPDLSGASVNPQIIPNYDGGDIVLNEQQRIVLSPREFPELANYKGHTLITTDGTTLLGADDKAGIAEIMTAMAYLIQHPEIKHGKVRVAFTPDEEIGRGAHRFNVEAFGADFAYTMDGGPLGELQYESFNAASAFVTFRGKNVHPGTAKGKMINAIKLAMTFHEHVPSKECPEHTEGYEGYFHLASFEGDVEQARLHYLIRDFDRDGFARRKEKLAAIAEAINEQTGESRVEIAFKDRYFNMREKIEPMMGIVEVARQAMTSLGIEPVIAPIRGGTDGSQLSYMGLPTPNLFAGGENFHGRYEYVSADTMAKAAEVIVAIIRLCAENPVIISGSAD